MCLLRGCSSRVPGSAGFFVFLGFLDLRDELLHGHGDRGRLTGGAASASRETDANVIAVSHLQLPQTHVTTRFTPVRRFVEVLIWVAGVEPGTAEVAKVRLATNTNHMVATVRLLGWHSAGRAGRGVHPHVFQRSQFLGRELRLVAAREAAEELAVP
jgi:hypothetical protein